MVMQKDGYTSKIPALCETTRTLIKVQKFEECKSNICEAMREHPHSPIPHNLMGIVLEKEGNHMIAMKHFRASYALDPTYLPARHNLDHYGTFFSKGECAYDESDCIEKARTTLNNFNNIGRDDRHTKGRN